MKRIITCILLMPCMASADSSSIGLSLPGIGATYGQDSISTGDLDCKNSIGGATNFEFGVTGVIDNYSSPFSAVSYTHLTLPTKA